MHAYQVRLVFFIWHACVKDFCFFIFTVVDVKLDPTRCAVSADGKKVRGETQKAPVALGAFGSILGLNIFTSGRFHWELEVGNQTGCGKK